LIDINVIKFPDKEAGSEVSLVRDKMAFTSKNVQSCKSSYCSIPPQHDACDIIKNSLVEYELIRNRLHKNCDAELLEAMATKLMTGSLWAVKIHKCTK
jgi:hypothetical protein